MGNSAVLPKFDGSMPAETFDTIVRAKALELGWTSAETAQNAIRAFEGPALKWFEEAAKNNPSLSKEWSELRKAFIQNFKKSGNLGDQIAGLFLEAKIPSFSGLDTRNFPVQKFILSVENMANLRCWTHKETYKNAVDSLTEKAAKEIRAETGLRNSWDNLRKKLLELYGPHMSLNERIMALRQMNQKSTETSDDFFTRIDSEMLLLEDDILKSAKSEEEREAMMRMHQLYSALFFVRGMNNNVRQRLLKMPVSTGKAKIPSLDEIISTAKTMEQYERIEKSQKAILQTIRKENQPVQLNPAKVGRRPKQQQPTQKVNQNPQNAKPKKQMQPQPKPPGPLMGSGNFHGPIDPGFYMPTSYAGNGVPQGAGQPFGNGLGLHQFFERDNQRGGIFMGQPPPYTEKQQNKKS